MIQGPSHRLNGIVCGLLSSVIWGAFPVVTRLGIEHTPLDMYDITFIRYGVSAILLLPFLLSNGLKGLGWRQIALMVIGIGAPYMLVVSQGLTYAPVERFAVVTPGSMIIFSVVLSSYFLKSRLTRYELTGIAAIIAGACLIGFKSFHYPVFGNQYTYAIFVVGGLMWSIYTISTRVFSVDSMHATAIVSVFSTLLYLPFYILLKGSSILQAPPHDIIVQAVYQGVFVSTLALFFYSKAVFFLGPSIGSTFAALVPGMAVILAAPILDEQPSPLSIAGLAVVTVGMVLCLFGRPSQRPTSESPPVPDRRYGDLRADADSDRHDHQK
jgi:drug/metabolite transporter (DMT)-like permease